MGSISRCFGLPGTRGRRALVALVIAEAVVAARLLWSAAHGGA